MKLPQTMDFKDFLPRNLKSKLQWSKSRHPAPSPAAAPPSIETHEKNEEWKEDEKWERM